MNSKGITPVVAVVLLMLITIAATSAAYEFIINTQIQVQQGYQKELNQEELQRQSDLNIEAIYKGSSGNAYMSVRNTGSVNQVIEDSKGKYWTIYVNGRPISGPKPGKSWSYVGPKPSLPVTLSPQSTININTGETFPGSGSGKMFKLSGRFGSTDTYFCKGGGSSC